MIRRVLSPLAPVPPRVVASRWASLPLWGALATFALTPALAGKVTDATSPGQVQVATQPAAPANAQQAPAVPPAAAPVAPLADAVPTVRPGENLVIEGIPPIP